MKFYVNGQKFEVWPEDLPSMPQKHFRLYAAEPWGNRSFIGHIDMTRKDYFEVVGTPYGGKTPMEAAQDYAGVLMK